jgi:hypothetical protein
MLIHLQMSLYPNTQRYHVAPARRTSAQHVRAVKRRGGGRQVVAVAAGASANSWQGGFNKRSRWYNPNTRQREEGLPAAVYPTRGRVACAAAEPIVVAVDVTGSMQEWPAVIYDKLPMFYGQLLMQGYLEDPALCFVGVADVDERRDRLPLQVTDFAQGGAIDREIKKLGLGGGGDLGKLGPDRAEAVHESYQLCAQYFLTRVDCPAATRKPIMFITGDEFFYEKATASQIKRFVDPGYCGPDLSSVEVFRALAERYDVFHLHRITSGYENEAYASKEDAIGAQWEAVLGPARVMRLWEPKACVDVMLGVIALLSGARTLEEYVDGDMAERGQTAARQQAVRGALGAFATSLPAAGAVAAGGSAVAGGSMMVVKQQAALHRVASSEAKLAHAAAFKQEAADDAALAKMRAEIARLKAKKVARGR